MSENSYFPRDISWLMFNQRVLDEAKNKNVPLLERLKFIGIFSSNLDEFFAVRYAALKRCKEKPEFEFFSTQSLFEQISDIVEKQQKEASNLLKNIKNELKTKGILFIDEKKANEKHIEYLSVLFREKILPWLSIYSLKEKTKPIIIEDGRLYLAVKLSGIKNKNFHFLIEVPLEKIDRFIVLGSDKDKDCRCLIHLEDVIRLFLKEIFSEYEYKKIESYAIKISRDSELEEPDNMPQNEQVAIGLKNRKIAPAVRLQYDKAITQQMLEYIKARLKIDSYDHLSPSGRYLNDRDYQNFPSLGFPEWGYKSKAPLDIAGLREDVKLLEQIKKRDYLLYAPYNKYNYIVTLLRQAALDPKVTTIKITLYRLAKDSQIISALINAAKNGKKVIVVLELRARFNEKENLMWSKELSEIGIEVLNGKRGQKIHAKICLIERMEGSKLVRYGFVSTGNLNEQTAKIYTDYTLLTANVKITSELNEVFNMIKLGENKFDFKNIMVSPINTRNTLYQLIENEIKNKQNNHEAYIKVKINSLVDFALIDKLYQASKAGVTIDLIVRGACCLLSGVENQSENIRTISIVDRYLEHQRVYIFCNDNKPKIYIASADFMPRNLDYRIEVGVPILDKNLQETIFTHFELSFSDKTNAKEQMPNGYYKELKGKTNSQQDIYMDLLKKHLKSLKKK